VQPDSLTVKVEELSTVELLANRFVLAADSGNMPWRREHHQKKHLERNSHTSHTHMYEECCEYA